MEICHTLYFLHALYKERGIFKNRTARSPRCSGPCGVVFCPNCASGARVTDKMVPPVLVSPLIKLGRYPPCSSAWALQRQALQSPETSKRREGRLAAERRRSGMSRSARAGELAEAQEDTILK